MGVDCDMANFVCVTGLQCFGYRGDLSFYELLSVGDACDENDPKDYCEAGATCENELCRAYDNGDCLKREARCIYATQCSVAYDGKKCTKPVPLGGDFASRFLKCDDELACDSGSGFVFKVDTFRLCMNGVNMCMFGN